ncbi:MAG: hypothetical protein RIM84_22260 [Alphaproteobacteria bacterium]
MHVAPVANMTLQYRGKSDTPPPAKLGVYLGGGDGRIEGEIMRGRVAWHLFEVQGQAACDASMAGRIEDDAGAQVDFETLGFFRRQADSEIWSLTAAIRFATSDRRLRALDGQTGWLRGHFNMQSYVHRYDVYLDADDKAGHPPS